MRFARFIALLVVATPAFGQSPPATAPATAPASAESRARTARTPINLLDKLTPKGTTLSVKTTEGRQITANDNKGVATAVTEDSFKGPLTITAVARTSAENLRLYFGEQGVLILNWENNNGELRHHDPRTGQQTGVPNKGAIRKNAFVTIRWTLDERSSRVEVDGAERVAFPGDFSDVAGTIGIGTVDANVLTVKSLQVTLLPEKPGPAIAAGSLPTLKEINELIDAGKYPAALPLLTRLIDLRGAQAAAFDRHQLLMSRAECLLQLRQAEGAMATLATARREATTPEKTYEAAALAELIQKSPGAKYTTGGKTRTTLDILDRPKRKEAFAALWTDLQRPFEADAGKAVAGPALPPLIQAGRGVPVARAVEFMATDKTEQSDKVAAQLRERGIALIDGALKDMKGRVDAVSNSANEVLITHVFRAGGDYEIKRKRGLAGNDVATLTAVEKTCAQLIATTQDFAGVFPGDNSFRDLATTARDLGLRAQAVRTDKY
jgi:hypothetical protein